MARYFVVYQDDKESTTLCFNSKKELSEFIDEYDDEKPTFVALEELQEQRDPAYWHGLLIIKGDVVTPKPKEVVKEWEF